MDSTSDYFAKLYDDLIEQFKNKPNIAVFQKALARQLDELYSFFYQLRTLRWLQNAEGKQLDGIGNIVDLSRTEALKWSSLAGQVVPMNDDLYRMYLMFKIFLNTSEATYKDIVRALKMFWPYTPIYYSEDIDIPATMFFTTPPMPMAVSTDLFVLQIVTRVKAAGVSLHFVIPTELDEDVGVYFATGKSQWIKEYIICDTTLMPTDSTNYNATAGTLITKEYIVEAAPMPDTIIDYGATAMNQIVKENYTE